MRREPLTPELKRKRRVRRFIGWGVSLALVGGGYLWQPLRIHVFQKKPPLLPRVDPRETGLFSKGTRVMIVTGHPDDCEFFLGGTLPQIREAGAVIRLVAMTNGDKAYYPFGVPKGLTETRKREQTEAAKRWGGDVVFLNYHDGRLPVNDESVAALRREVDGYQPDVVMTFDHEFGGRRTHRDHDSAGENAVLALKDYEQLKWLLLFGSRGPNCFVEISDTWDEKVELLKLHKSQFHGARLQFISDFLMERAIQDGTTSGLNMAESFRAVRVGG